MAPSSENQKFETDNLIVGRTEPEINENQKFNKPNSNPICIFISNK
jgi:hypothetical protein